MQSKVNLEEQFSYSNIGFILFIIFLICLISYIVYYLINKTLNKRQEQNNNIRPFKDILRIKNNYLGQIDIIVNELNSNKIKSRTAYNKLSVLIRRFILEATNIDLLKCSLSEIKKKDTGILYELIKEYYEPEFSKEIEGDITSSINKTRKVIEEWQ